MSLPNRERQRRRGSHLISEYIQINTIPCLSHCTTAHLVGGPFPFLSPPPACIQWIIIAPTMSLSLYCPHHVSLSLSQTGDLLFPIALDLEDKRLKELPQGIWSNVDILSPFGSLITYLSPFLAKFRREVKFN